MVPACDEKRWQSTEMMTTTMMMVMLALGGSYKGRRSDLQSSQTVHSKYH